MRKSRYAASSLVAIAVFLGIGLTWGANPSALDELAVAIERVRTGPDGERIVVGHISRKLSLSVEVLRAQQAQTRLGWGELLIANLLSRETKLTVDKVVAEFRGGLGWTEIARHNDVNLDQLINEVRQSQQVMEQRTEDRAPPRSSETQSSPATTAPTTSATPRGAGPAQHPGALPNPFQTPPGMGRPR